MSDSPKHQMLIPFPEVSVESVSPAPVAAGYEPSDEALAAFERLEGWLLDARGKPV